MRYDLLVVAFILIAVLSFVADIITKRQHREKIIVFFVLSTIIILSSVGLLKNVNLRGHDSHFHLNRIQGMAQNINNGVPFTKVNYFFNAGYGYFDPIFYPRLFLWRL